MGKQRGRPKSRPGRPGRPGLFTKSTGPPRGRPRPPGAGFSDRAPEPIETPQVAPPGVLADAATWLAEIALPAVLNGGRRLDRVVVEALRKRRDLAAPDARFVADAVGSLFRWRGWVEPSMPGNVAGGLLLAMLLDGSEVHPACRFWAREAGIDPGRLIPLADAPSWTARTDGYKRIVEGRPTIVDPWRLFPPWFREVVALPPGEETPKARGVALIESLQSPPRHWVRLRAKDPAKVWDELREQGLRPWQHRRIAWSGRLEPDVDPSGLRLRGGGAVESQDLAGQAVGIACDPEPGERWWVMHGSTGGHVQLLADLLANKGTVVATDPRPRRLQSVKLQARRGGRHNIQAREWDGRHIPGKSGTFDGVLVAPPCSAIGTWRRHPDERWTTDPAAIPRFAAEQREALRIAAPALKPGGVLVYAVATLTTAETSEVARGFLADRPDFRFDRYAHPLTEELVEGELTLWPHLHDSDAVYIARFVRTKPQTPRPPKASQTAAVLEDPQDPPDSPDLQDPPTPSDSPPPQASEE